MVLVSDKSLKKDIKKIIISQNEITRDSDNRCEFLNNGIISIVRKDFDDQKENWILTGFHYTGKDKEKIEKQQKL